MIIKQRNLSIQQYQFTQMVLHRTLVLVMILLAISNSLRFCAWMQTTASHSQLREQPNNQVGQHRNNMPPQLQPQNINANANVRQPLHPNLKGSQQVVKQNINIKTAQNVHSTQISHSTQTKIQKNSKIQSMLRKNQKFRSHHPHYLHSYSYPEPISPHIFFGQANRSNSYVFLIKDNQTINNQITNQIFYVNGKQEYGSKNFLNKNGIDKNDLQFAMVAQIQNMLTEAVDTKLIVYHFGKYLGIVCKVYQDYYKSFVVYISNKGKSAIDLTNPPEQLIIGYKDNKRFNNQMSWKNGFQSYAISSLANITMPANGEYAFESFIMTIKYNSIQAAQNYKIAVKEFPIRVYEDEQEILQPQITSFEEYKQKMKQISIDSFQYRFFIETEIPADSCQVKAQKQIIQGLSYQYGTLQLKDGGNVLPNQPKQLFSFSPSRKRFPWGFLWDDGFHCEVAVRNEAQLAIKVIKSWLDTMHDSGWIPREQNRGAERQFLCSCPRFMAKDVKDGNPPTLLIPLGFLAREDVLKNDNFPEKYWNKLQSWYNWFIDTQMTKPNSYIFRWHDSIVNEGSFNSGMDDFPRMTNTQAHVDCQAWMYFFAKTMSEIAQSLGYLSEPYSYDARKIRQQFIANFIDSHKIPNDYISKLIGKSYNPHFGYPSILPIAFGMIDESSQVYNSTMRKIKQQLDSGYGLTSISKNDKVYLTGDAYWRGPVWININYLFLRGLNLYYPSEKQYYKKLRKDLISTVCSQQQKTGYFFENYINGKGSFSFPFTGWTALISVIVTQNY